MRYVLLLSVALAATIPADANSDELSEMKSALAAALKSIKGLQKRVQVLESEKKTAASGESRKAKALPPVVRPTPPNAVAAPVVASDLKPAAVIPEAQKARLEIHSAVQLDAIYDLKKVNPNWEGTLRPSQIPVNCPPLEPILAAGRVALRTSTSGRAIWISEAFCLPIWAR